MSYRFDVHLQSAPNILNEVSLRCITSYFYIHSGDTQLAKVAVRHGMDPATRVTVMCYGSRQISSPPNRSSAGIFRTRTNFHHFNQGHPIAIRSHMEAPVSREQFWYEATLPLQDLHACTSIWNGNSIYFIMLTCFFARSFMCNVNCTSNPPFQGIHINIDLFRN